MQQAGEKWSKIFQPKPTLVTTLKIPLRIIWKARKPREIIKKTTQGNTEISWSRNCQLPPQKLTYWVVRNNQYPQLNECLITNRRRVIGLGNWKLLTHSGNRERLNWARWPPIDWTRTQELRSSKMKSTGRKITVGSVLGCMINWRLLMSQAQLQEDRCKTGLMVTQWQTSTESSRESSPSLTKGDLPITLFLPTQFHINFSYSN